jgi:hypothetical protein
MQRLAKQSRYVMNTELILNYFKHLSSCYSSEKEFIDHMLSGEVKVSIPDIIRMMESQSI